MPPIQHNIPIRVFIPPSALERTSSKIILLKLGERIGDFIIAADSFRLIRQAFPQSEITLLCLPSIVALAQSTGLFDKVKGFSHVHDVIKQTRVPKMDEADQLAAFTSVLDGPYLLAADFRHDGSTRGWLDHIDAQVRAGFSAPTQRGLDIAVPQMEWDVPMKPMPVGKSMPVHAEARLVMLAQAIVEAFTAEKSEAALFPVPQSVKEQAFYKALANDSRLKVGLCVGAGSELRKWKTDYWAVLLQRLVAIRGASIVFFGGPEDQEESAALAAQLPPDHVHDLTGSLSLDQLPGYLGLLDAYIGCDTGLTHLAAGLGVPTVNIFAGISNVSVWRARGPRVRTVYAEVICGPCHLRLKSECPNNNVCMGALMPDIIYACFEQLIPV